MRVNGIIIALEKEQTLLDFLTAKQFDVTRIAVECNGEIIPKTSYKDIQLKDDDILEIVQFVGGG